MKRLKKSLVITIIFLFIGVTVAPSINQSVVKASNDNDLVEVTTQACGIKGYGYTTVKLTKEQYQNLEQYIVEFRARLNQTTTKEEVIPIFKEAVVELDKYGLLPRGMSVERAQRLVSVENLNKDILRLYRKINHDDVASPGHLHNHFSFIAGEATNCYIASPLLIINGLFGLIADWFLSFSLYRFLPVNLFGKILFSHYWECNGALGGSSGWDKSKGEIFTFGILGNGSLRISGDFLIGNIRAFYTPLAVPGYNVYYLGIRGFSGIQFYNKTSGSKNFFGWCLEVDVISSEMS